MTRPGVKTFFVLLGLSALAIGVEVGVCSLAGSLLSERAALAPERPLTCIDSARTFTVAGSGLANVRAMNVCGVSGCDASVPVICGASTCTGILP